MPNQQDQLPRRWTQSQRDWAMVAWVAFLAACVGEFLLFAVLDPAMLGEALVLGWNINRLTGYAIGFGMMYAVGFVAAGLAVFMIRTGPVSGHASGQGRRPPPEIHDPAENNPDLAGEEWK